MNCIILTKSEKFKFSNVSPLIFNIIYSFCFDIDKFAKTLKDGNYNHAVVDSMVKEINNAGEYEIIVDQLFESFAYRNSNGDSLFISDDFYEKFNINEIIKKDISKCKDENEIKLSISENIIDIYNEHQIWFWSLSIKFLHELANKLTCLIDDCIDNLKTYNYIQLIKYCGTMFNGQCGIYRLARYGLLKLYNTL